VLLDRIRMLSDKSSAGGYSRVLKGKTQLRDICENVQSFFLSDEHRRRNQHGGIDSSCEKRPQSIRYAPDLHYCDILSGSQTDFFEGVARHKIRGRPERADDHCASFELLGAVDLGLAHKPIVQ